MSTRPMPATTRLCIALLAAMAMPALAQETGDRHDRFGHVRTLVFAHEGDVVEFGAHDAD